MEGFVIFNPDTGLYSRGGQITPIGWTGDDYKKTLWGFKWSKSPKIYKTKTSILKYFKLHIAEARDCWDLRNLGTGKALIIGYRITKNRNLLPRNIQIIDLSTNMPCDDIDIDALIQERIDEWVKIAKDNDVPYIIQDNMNEPFKIPDEWIENQ